MWAGEVLISSSDLAFARPPSPEGKACVVGDPLIPRSAVQAAGQADRRVHRPERAHSSRLQPAIPQFPHPT